MRSLQLRVSLSYLRAGLTEPKAQLPEQSLALTDFQVYLQFSAEKLR